MNKINNKLDDIKQIRLIVSNVLFRSANAVLYIFLSIFIWEQTGDIREVFLFSIIIGLTHTFFFALFGMVVKNGYRRIGLAIGPLLSLIIFGLLIIFKNEILNYIYILAFFLGLKGGIYWVTFNNNVFDITNFSNRGNFEGIKKSLYITLGIIIPILIGGLISLNMGGLGYEMAFGVGVIMFLLSLIIGNIDVKIPKKRKYEFLESLKIFLKDKDILKFLVIYFFLGLTFNIVLIDFLLPMMVYGQIGEEYKLGISLSIFSLVSALGVFLYGKFVSYKHYSRIIFIVGVLYSIFMIGILEFPYLVTLFTSLLTFIYVFYSLSTSVIGYNIIHKLKNYEKVKSEYAVIREIFLMTGRTLVYVLLFFIGSIDVDKLYYLFYFMIVIVSICSIVLAKIKVIESQGKKEY